MTKHRKRNFPVGSLGDVIETAFPKGGSHRRRKPLRCALEIIGNCYGKVELAMVRQRQLVPTPLCRKHRGER